MPAPTFSIPQGNLIPVIQEILLDGEGAAIPLLGDDLTVLFRMRGIGSCNGIRFERPAEIIDAPGGLVRYTWIAGDTDIPGNYIAEWVIMLGDKPMSVPVPEYVNIKIRPMV